MDFLKESIKENFTPKELNKLRYLYLAIGYETSKFILMFTFFLSL